MTALLYFVVAVFVAAQATRAWWSDRDDLARNALLTLGWTLALAYAGFAISLLPGLGGFRSLYMLAGGFAPSVALWAVDEILRRPGEAPSRDVRVWGWGTAFVIPPAVVVHLAAYGTVGGASPAELVAGGWGFLGLYRVVDRIAAARRAARWTVARTRLGWLLAVVVGAAVATLAEHLGRNLGEPIDAVGLSLSQRDAALQGLIPPFSPVLAGLAIHLLHHTVTQARLPDPHELLAKGAALAAATALLGLVDGLTFLWVDTFTLYPYHSTYQILLASLVFLAVYDPLVRERIAAWLGRRLNPGAYQLVDAVGELRRELPARIDRDEVADDLVAGLHGSGRFADVALWLWSGDDGGFRVAAFRGREPPPLVLAEGSFTEPFARGQRWLMRPVDAARSRDPRLDLLEEMGADAAFAIVRGDVVFGWLAVRDDAWMDALGSEELVALRDLMDAVGLALANIRDFQAREEAQRLAALGTMAAGLAHEIRNPLAGMKGAAQFLLAEDVDAGSREMLGVIVQETNRLDRVVSRFLDYARPFELSREPVDIDALVARVLVLARADGVAPGVEIVHLPDGRGLSVSLDAALVGQVVWNLVRNAVVAVGNKGRVVVRTTVRDGAHEPTVEIAVIDDGPGIPEEIRGRLFLPFATTRARGTGLGLAISSRIVRAHGGEFVVASTVGQGATFTVKLPGGALPAAAAV